MRIHDVTALAGGRPRRKRVGRGESSGMGRTSGRGNKGAQSRAGYGGRELREGGQMPIFRRIPKRGFSNENFRTAFEVVNLDALEQLFDNGARVDPAAMAGHRLVQVPQLPVKVLGRGQLSKKLTVVAHAFSEKARQAIEQAGGKAEVMELRDAAGLWKAKHRKKRGEKRAAGPTRLEKKKAAGGGRSGG